MNFNVRKCSLWCALLGCLWAGSAYALTPAQLVEPFFSDKAHIDYFTRDVAFHMSQDTSAAGLFMRLGFSQSDAFPDAIYRIQPHALKKLVARMTNPNQEFSSVFAAEVTDEFDESQFPVPPFTVENVPAGTTVRPLKYTFSQKLQNNTLSASHSYTALMTRGTERFLIASNRLDVLSQMAAVSDSAPEIADISDAPNAMKFVIPPTALPEETQRRLTGGEMLFRDTVWLKLEIDSTQNTITANISSNFQEFLASTASFSGITPKDAAQSAPLLIGSSAPLALLSVENLFDISRIPEVGQQISESLNNAARSARIPISLTPQDINDILNGRITLALAGSSATLAGDLPGVYLHLSGANTRTSDLLLRLVAQKAKGQNPESFSAGPWNGVRTARWALFSAYAATGNGFIAAFQNSSQLAQTPLLPARLAHVQTQPDLLTFDIDVSALRTQAQVLLARLGTFLNAGQESEARSFIDALQCLESLNLSVTNLNSAHVELVFNRAELERNMTAAFLSALTQKRL